MSGQKCVTCNNESYEECMFFGGNVISMDDDGINFENCTRYSPKNNVEE